MCIESQDQENAERIAWLVWIGILIVWEGNIFSDADEKDLTESKQSHVDAFAVTKGWRSKRLLWNPLRWPIYVINSFVIPNYPAILFHRRSTTVFL